MKSLKFKEANAILTAPQSMPKCNDLHTYSDGRSFVSIWELTQEEINAVVLTGRLKLTVVGSVHPPVSIESNLSLSAFSEPKVESCLYCEQSFDCCDCNGPIRRPVIVVDSDDPKVIQGAIKKSLDDDDSVGVRKVSIHINNEDGSNFQDQVDDDRARQEESIRRIKVKQ